MKKFFSNTLNVILTIGLIAVLTCLIILAINILGIGKEKAVIAEDLSGKSITEVTKWIEDKKLPQEKYSIQYEYDETIPENILIYQSVKAGDPIKESINFVFSKGIDPSTIKKDTVKVPDFNEMSEEEILKWGEDNKVTINIDYAFSDTIEKGKIISQSVAADGEAEVDSAISVVISNGKNSGGTTPTGIIVPDTYLGYTEENFKKAIEALGLVPVKQDKTYVDKSFKNGTVYSYQSTSDGITFNKGDSVKYYLVDNGKETPSTGDTVVVPDTYLGYTEENFKKAIEALGLVPVKQDKTYEAQGYKDGTVYSYDSTSDGISFKKGDQVKYYLVKNSSQGGSDNEPVTVPDSYIGYKEADFISAIEKLGLKPSKQSKTYTSQKYATGTVYAYDSTSDGINFKKGDTVKYYLVDNGDGQSTETVVVPDTYLGYKEADFIKAIENLGLKPVKQSKTYKSQKYATGTVYIYDSTSDGIVFKKGDTVRYYLVDNGDGGSSGTETVTVPDSYIGYKESEFISAIEKLGLKPVKQSKTYTSQKYATGTVYAYDSTSDGIVFKKGDTVKYYLVDNGEGGSQGGSDTDVKLADLVGKTQSEAQEWLQSKGLAVSIKEQTSSSVASGKVISMSPAAGTTVKSGSTVTITVSKGANTSSILAPNLLISNYSRSTYQESADAIKGYFNDQGFNNVAIEGVSSTKSIGQIISISVDGDSAYSAGDYPVTSSIKVQIVNERIN